MNTGLMPFRFTLMVLMLLWVVVGPSPVAADTSVPSCSLFALYNNAIEETKSQTTLTVVKDDLVGLVWYGQGARTAVDGTGTSVPLLGATVLTPTKDATYSYTFSSGATTVTCGMTLEVVSGTLSTKSTAKSGEKITLKGSANDVKNVVVVITKNGTTTASYRTGVLSVSRDAFSIKMPKALPDGTYDVTLTTVGNNPLTLATRSLVVGKPAPVFKVPLVVRTIPLLSGGAMKAGSGVAVSYLQVINVGTTPAVISGFTLQQNGSAPAPLIVGVSINDELGLAKGSVGNMVSGSPFVGTNVLVPVPVTLAAKESRLFTVRAVLGATAVQNIGQTMSLALVAMSGDVSVQSGLPLNGVVWTIVR